MPIELEYTKIRLENGIITYGGNQMMFGKRVKKSGCGMIAALDLSLFLNKSNVFPLTITEYKRHITFSESWFYKNSANLFGISPRKIIRYLSENLNGRDFSFICGNKLSKSALNELLRKALCENTPVIIRIGENLKRLPYKITFPAGNSYNGKMRWHYITAVGLNDDTLVFYSWGGRGEMNINDLCNYFGFTGGIILPTDMYK